MVFDLVMRSASRCRAKSPRTLPRDPDRHRSFHYSSISPRTFDICRETLEAGVDPVLVARNVYDSNSMGRLKLFGAVLSAMQIDATGRIASSISITTWRARPAAPTKTPKG
jgi:nanoRNase/pAp phosphatase (c-di-AMP/oligoRNAs hydrolase)